jgi:DNA-binding NarL/FixJ family response regulator
VSEETRIVVVDDHDTFRDPLAFMLEREPDLTVVARRDPYSKPGRSSRARD